MKRALFHTILNFGKRYANTAVSIVNLLRIVLWYYAIILSLFFFSETFSCGPPSSPSNGYIDSYNLTEGGLTVIFVCQNNNSCLKGLPGSPKVSYTVVAVCTLDGNWDPNLDEFCSMTSLSKTVILRLVMFIIKLNIVQIFR